MNQTSSHSSTTARNNTDFVRWSHNILPHPAFALPYVSCRFDKAEFRPDGVEFGVHMYNWVAQRKAEFVAGRICAQAALSAHGHGHFTVGIGAHREPLWPHGMLGSITHSDDYAAAVVCHAGPLIGVGIDIERIIADAACTDLLGVAVSRAEISKLAVSSTELTLPNLLTLLFSAKESFFKAAFPLVKQYFDFDAVELVSFDSSARLITLRCVEFLCAEFQEGFTFQAGFALLDSGYVMTMVVLENLTQHRASFNHDKA